MGNVVEAYYTPQELAVLLKFTTQWITVKVLNGEFGRCLRIGQGKSADYRVPASGVNAFIARNSIGCEPEPAPILARTEGELRRKVNVNGRRDGWVEVEA